MTFAYPLRPWQNFYVGKLGFLSPDYHAEYGKYHRGVDINGRGGGDTDLGYPVQSMFPGEVVYAAQPGSWGGVVLVRSDEWVRAAVEKLLDVPLEVLDVQYAHLQQRSVAVGERLNAGEHLGSVGKGSFGQYLAHLHLEVRSRPFDAFEPQGGDDAARTRAQETCLDPTWLLKTLPLADRPGVIPEGRFESSFRLVEVEGVSYAQRRVVVNRILDKLYFK